MFYLQLWDGERVAVQDPGDIFTAGWGGQRSFIHPVVSQQRVCGKMKHFKKTLKLKSEKESVG